MRIARGVRHQPLFHKDMWNDGSESQKYTIQKLWKHFPRIVWWIPGEPEMLCTICLTRSIPVRTLNMQVKISKNTRRTRTPCQVDSEAPSRSHAGMYRTTASDNGHPTGDAPGRLRVMCTSEGTGTGCPSGNDKTRSRRIVQLASQPDTWVLKVTWCSVRILPESCQNLALDCSLRDV